MENAVSLVQNKIDSPRLCPRIPCSRSYSGMRDASRWTTRGATFYALWKFVRKSFKYPIASWNQVFLFVARYS